MDFSGSAPKFVPGELAYDYEKWGDPVNETRERYTTTVYNIEVEDWHTYFVGKLGLWVHNTNCVDAKLTVETTVDTVGALIEGGIQMGSQGSQFKSLTKAELNYFLKNNPTHRDGFGIIRMDGSGKFYKMTTALAEGNWEAAWENGTDALSPLLSFEFGETPKLWSALKQKVKQMAFDDQVRVQGVITQSVTEYLAKGPEGEVLTLKTERVSDPLKPAEPPKEITRLLTKEEVAAECNDSLQFNLDGSVEFRSPFDEPVCFVAGTLVHARQGLVPIEQLKVGDFVLSKSDTGDGPKEYKRVTKTFSRESEEVFLVEYVLPGEKIAQSLVVTSEHPFWVDRVGWTSARNLCAADDLVIHRDSSVDEFASVFRVQIVWDTGVPDVGWSGGSRDAEGMERGEGPTVDLRNGAVFVTQPDDDAWNQDAVALGEPLRRQVFNIEVEDFHTYYVGEAGVWVHNACPPRIEGTVASRGVTMNNPAETAAGLAPESRAMVYSYRAASELVSRLIEQREGRRVGAGR